MTLSQVNYLNVLLIGLSCSLAYFLPFELFLFSYAVLGPLHYLTEIGWLHKRSYFTNGPKDYYWLLGIGVVIVTLFLGQQALSFNNMATGQAADNQYWIDLFRVWIANLIIIAFLWGLASTVFRSLSVKLSFTLIASGLLLLISSLQPLLIGIAALLPTLIHVSLFMVAFILYGALRSKSVSGYLSVLVFIACSVLFFIYQPAIHYQAHPLFMQSYLISDFDELNVSIAGWLGVQGGTVESILYSPLGISLQRFVAFSYTYHYLNWFSKTHVISWHEVSRRWLVTSGILWVVSVGLYLYDFSIGLTVLFLLSLMHVFLEFPLNYRSLMGIYTQLRSRVVGTAST